MNKVLEVKGFKHEGKYFMKVTRFDRDGKAIERTDEAGVDSITELYNVMTEYQILMRNYGTRVLLTIES